MLLQIAAVTSKIAGSISVLGLPWQFSCLLLALSYFYSHYFFASNLSHVSAMCQAFLAIAIAAGFLQHIYISYRLPATLY